MRLGRWCVVLLALGVPSACSGNFDGGKGAPDGSAGDASQPDSSDDGVIVVVPGPDGSAEAGSDAAVPGDGGGDAGSADGPIEGSTPPPVLGCAVMPNTQVLVDDLSALAGGGEFSHLAGLAQLDGNASAYVVAQRQADSNQFLVYSVDFGARTSSSTPVTGLGNNLDVLDVAPSGTTAEVLVAYEPTGATTENLEIVPLLNSGGSPGPAWTLPGSTVPSYVISGLLSPGPQADGYIVYSSNSSGTLKTLSAGQGTQGGSGAVVTLTQSSTSLADPVNAGALVSIGNTNYAAFGLQDGGLTEFVYPANASDAGTNAPVNVNGDIGIILGWQVDPSNAANVEAVAVNLSGGVNLTLWGGSIPQASLVPLSIGAPQFTQSTVLALGDLPAGKSATTWTGSELLRVGTPADSSSGVVLLWVGPTGRVVSRAATSGKLVNTPNPVVNTGLLVLQQVGELEATLAVAWVERVTPDSGAAFDRLYAAEVSCTPLPSAE